MSSLVTTSRGQPLATSAIAANAWPKPAKSPGITVQPIARGRASVFVLTEIAWVVERSFGWLSRCRQ
ncbi:transposase [Azospirillum canadense]|nr:transposase [Azospirillum canadense]